MVEYKKYSIDLVRVLYLLLLILFNFNTQIIETNTFLAIFDKLIRLGKLQFFSKKISPQYDIYFNKIGFQYYYFH